MAKWHERAFRLTLQSTKGEKKKHFIIEELFEKLTQFSGEYEYGMKQASNG